MRVQEHMTIFAGIKLGVRPLLKRFHTKRLHLNSHNSQKSKLVKSSKNVVSPTWRGGSTAPGHGRRSVHRRTLSSTGRVWAMWRILLLRPFWKTSWSSLDMVLASTGWPPTLSLSKVIFGPVIEWWCSCKSDLFLPSSWQQCWQCWCTWWTPQVVRKTSWRSTRSGWRPSGQRRGSPSNIHSGDLRPSGRRLLVGLSASFLTTIKMLTIFCRRSLKNYSWIMLACSGFTHPPEFQLFKVKQRWNLVKLTRCPLMEPKRLKTCGNKEPKQLLAVNWWGVISVLRRVCTVVEVWKWKKKQKTTALAKDAHAQLKTKRSIIIKQIINRIIKWIAK